MRLMLLAAVACSVLGCTRMAPLAPDAIEKLERGDRISVRTDAGWYEGLRVVDVPATSVRTERRREPMVFARADIVEIQVARAAPGRTAALAVAIFLGGQLALCGNLADSEGC